MFFGLQIGWELLKKSIGSLWRGKRMFFFRKKVFFLPLPPTLVQGLSLIHPHSLSGRKSLTISQQNKKKRKCIEIIPFLKCGLTGFKIFYFWAFAQE
jgi:hypothetical protein